MIKNALTLMFSCRSESSKRLEHVNIHRGEKKQQSSQIAILMMENENDRESK
jgi:hypothetical protein